MQAQAEIESALTATLEALAELAATHCGEGVVALHSAIESLQVAMRTLAEPASVEADAAVEPVNAALFDSNDDNPRANRRGFGDLLAQIGEHD